MGKLLSILRSDAEVTSDIFVDFENTKPTAEEQQLYDYVTDKMKGSIALIDALKNYTGCGEQIRKVSHSIMVEIVEANLSRCQAISSPGKQTEEEAWAAVCPAVGQLKTFFDFSTVLEECFTKLLRQLCQGSSKQNLEKYQALANLIAKILVFALDFDDLKMTNPSIQNDFSYYRRTLSRLKMSPENKDLLENAVVKDELANRMSLFYAYPTPMLKTLVDGLAAVTSSSAADKLPTDQVTECLQLMVSVCHVAVIQNKFAKTETMFFCLRVMVACIILYDHVHPKGAFVKESDINVKTHIKLIQTNGANHTDGLLNALRYTTKHLNDESTPKAVKAMLG